MTRFYHCLLVFVLLSCGCARGCSERPLAELREVSGEVSRDFRGREQQWAPAPVGSEFSYGDALRTAKGSLAEVRVGKSGRVLVESETVVRFLDHVLPGAEASSELQVTQGSATVEAASTALTLKTRTGTAVLSPGTKVLLKPAQDVDTYRVLVGSVAFHQDDGKTIDVSEGHSIAIGIGLAVMDDDGSASGQKPSAASAASLVNDEAAGGLDAAVASGDVQDASAADAATGPDELAASEANAEEESEDPQAVAGAATRPGQEDAEDNERSASELEVPAGESFEVFDPTPPTVLGIAVPRRCRDGAELRLRDGRRAVRSSDVLVARLRQGVHRYAVYCLRGNRRGRRVASGRVVVRRASGTRSVPKSAPHNAIDLDGHRYRLMYQNLRPIIDVSWPSAPKADSYTLSLERAGAKPKQFETQAPSYVLPSRALRDGKQVLVMQAHDAAGTRSKATTLDIAFDNAAPTASLELPPVSGFRASGHVQVRGIAALGTRVSIDGERVKVDRRGTFSHRLQLARGRAALGVRFQHRKHGVRYYIRRVRRRPR